MAITDMVPRELNASALRQWPLPKVGNSSDKEDRGQVLIIAGSREIPGAAILAATAALRAGAGKLTIATARSVAPHLGLLVPESRVVGLPETAQGGFPEEGIELLQEFASSAAAVLIGPGLMDGAGSAAFFAAAIGLFSRTPLILDALAMDGIMQASARPVSVLLTPHAGEMAHLTCLSKDQVKDESLRIACELAKRCNAEQAVVTLKGSETFIVTTEGQRWKHTSNNPGLGTSGSGDVLAGIMTGLAARGAELAQAAAWGVCLHAMAGQTLSGRYGRVGFLARDLPGEIPHMLRQLDHNH